MDEIDLSFPLTSESEAMTPLQTLLESFRAAAKTEREKGTYFENLIVQYLKVEPYFRDQYSNVWPYRDWARGEGKDYALDAADDGIDLVAKTRGTEEYHAIQCKFYDANHTIAKSDIDSFFTASGQAPFAHRLIVASTDKWGNKVEPALSGQHVPVTIIDLAALEASQIDWTQFNQDKPPVLKESYALKPHQKKALKLVRQGLASTDRGKMIMACGTGKTFVSLKIAEQIAGSGKRVLFMVPSLALLSQTLTEWTQQKSIPMHCFAVCSDAHVGKKRKKDEDPIEMLAHELRYPATTTPDRLAVEMAKRHDDDHMSVVFSTYHSIEVLHDAQHKHGLAGFDLIICDEAHRTTGAIFEGIDESHFVRVHDSEYILGDKRLYMTATPRIYGPASKAKAEKKGSDITLCSMDDEQLYGKELYVLSFSEAVQRKLLVDYKVIVLAMDEAHVSRRLQNSLADESNQLRVDDAAKIVGCWKALSKEGLQGDEAGPDARTMRRAVAFCQVIEHQPKKNRRHKVSSKHIARMFQPVVEEYQALEDSGSTVVCKAEHVDGTMNATEKEAKLAWLKSEPPDNQCHILSNVRCLSEGVDVPALDAVLFLTPRNSQVDVVQSVGRVMRNAPGKTRGYVILPVVVPAGVEPDKALNNNDAFSVVWKVLQALRSHDDHFDAFVNKLDLVGIDDKKMEVIAVTDHLAKPAERKQRPGSEHTIGEPREEPYVSEQTAIHFEIGEIERAIYAKVVQKCGRRMYWEDWASDVAEIAQTHITRISMIVNNEANTREVDQFNKFANELRDDLNDSITDEEVIEMLAQHLITKPVFDALFEGSQFVRDNQVSKAMQGVLDVLQEHHLDKEADTLSKFYQSVRMRASGIDTIEGKQRIVQELYDKFFRNAFPRMTERLGIVYTPVEVVDFIIHSVNELLQQEFGQTLGSKGVHILDPFTGTGTFITRLLQSGLITPEELPRKYQREIHANEIVLLAYYIAAINIETVYHDLVGRNEADDYQPFEGICLTDTFQMYESKDMLADLLPVNSERRKRQVDLDIRVIMSNPPYSAGQKSANDNAKNVVYPSLDRRIRETYARNSTATLQRKLYDSYIRAIRWGSDQIGDAGVMAYVSGSAWIERAFADSMRKCLAEEFTNLYVFSLRGDIRKNMLSSGAAKEGENIFESGSMNGIAITLFVKNPAADTHGNICFHDIGDDLSRKEKLNIIRLFGSVNGIIGQDGWQTLEPDENHDWLNQTTSDFDRFLMLGDKKNKVATPMFRNYSLGVATNRDLWCYNASKYVLESNIKSMIAFYHAERERYHQTPENARPDVATFIVSDPKKISWTRALKQDLKQDNALTFAEGEVLVSAYRPFTKQWMYYGRRLNEMVLQMPKIFPNGTAENRVICVTGKGSRSGFSALMCDTLPDLNLLEAGAQCFPLKLYEETATTGDNDDMFQGQVHDGIGDVALAHFQAVYPKVSISKEDLFYYLYGVLHSEDYRTRYRNNLIKQLPRLPVVTDVEDFLTFQKAGRELADLHLGYERVDPYAVTINNKEELPNDLKPENARKLYRVEKMKHGKGKDGKPDRSKVEYNDDITLTDIPLEAYEYVVSGKSAIKWVMDQQGVKTHIASGIVNDANRYAIETMENPAYPLELLLRIIRVSIETMKVVKELPALRESELTDLSAAA